ncbi:hypothetical protein PUR61_13930 [Streptomyces sp. BE20]|uniref:hypothetical protein n=1 Tax=Streptomyces sp. BE20 TaxID=3002525 RepID=UPI002E79B4A9|nr:hypothetical protein [Streptomyces sp. BE20]MEE1823280.1 hypothetical protein [Streptomyces sp. BE20]
MDKMKRHGRNLARAAAVAALALGTGACSSGGGAAIRAAVVLSEPDQVQDALPSPASLPAGWGLSSGSKPPQAIGQAEASSTCRKKLSVDCEGLELGGSVRYELAADTDNDIRFTLLTFDTVENAGPVFEALAASLEKADDDVRPITLKVAADQARGFEQPADSADSGGGTVASSTAMRVGTVVALIELDEDERDHKTLQQFATLQAERIKQVQQGTDPDA